MKKVRKAHPPSPKTMAGQGAQGTREDIFNIFSP